jgi:polysaccharide export outer membrane protein
MRLLSFCCIILAVLCFSSCSPQKKTSYYYLENLQDTTGKETLENYEPVIQKNDLLSIQVYSAATDPKVDALYNLVNTNTSGSSNQAAGFLVDANGNIEYPRIGLVHAEGLTKEQLAAAIKTKIGDALINPSIVIRFLNFRVTVLGEVGHPGTITVPFEKVNILELVGLAGDIPLSGKKDKIRIIRESNGTRESGIIDLTSKDVFKSPYFYLAQNDIIIVDPVRAKIRANEESIVLQRITFALTFVTTAALLYNLFK